VLIDTQNLYHTAKHVYKNARVNFGNVVKDAVAGRSLVRALAYVITTESGDEKSFFQALEKMGIEIKTKELQTFVDGSKKADWDVAIAVDAIRIAARVDVVVVVSGDGDFVPLAQHLKQMGVQVEIVCFGQSASSKLMEEADIFTDLSTDVDYFLINSNSKVPARGARGVQRPTSSSGGRPVSPYKNKLRFPKGEAALKDQLESMQEESVPLSDNHFTIVRKK
jgi:uncharacterized LabA/DUF88 family protein